jgi:hypothetical protein
VHTPVEIEEDFKKVCLALTKVKGWAWRKGMLVLSGWILEKDGSRTMCENVRTDDVFLGRPFSDMKMQTLKDAIPDLREEKTIEICLEILRELWKHQGVRIVESGDGFALLTRNGQSWAKNKYEVILMGFETIQWNDRDGGRWD